MKVWKPTAEQLQAAYGEQVPDLIRPNLRVLFCGINPSLYSAAVGHHFARPGNRFWPALHRAGFTPRQLSPFEEQQLLEHGCGITNIVARATNAADELSNDELIAGGKVLERKLKRYRPQYVAFVGITAYRTAFGQKGAKVGLQPDQIAETRVWVLPNPSGLNAHYHLKDLARVFGELRAAVAA